MRKFEFDPAPLVLAFLLGPLMEVSMRQALLLSQGSFCHLFHPADFSRLPGNCGGAAFNECDPFHEGAPQED